MFALPRRTRSHRAPVSAVVAVSLALVACSSGSPAKPATEASPTPDLTVDANRFEQVTQFGTGRAIAAAATDSLMVIASTIGVDVHRGDDVEEIPTALPFPIIDVELTPDAR